MQTFQVLIDSPIPPDRHLLPSILILTKTDTHNSNQTPHSPGSIALLSRKTYFASVLDTYLSGDITPVFLRAQTQPLQNPKTDRKPQTESDPDTYSWSHWAEIYPSRPRPRPVRFPFHLPAMSWMTHDKIATSYAKLPESKTSIRTFRPNLNSH
jgi:hypothetical protein